MLSHILIIIQFPTQVKKHRQQPTCAHRCSFTTSETNAAGRSATLVFCQLATNNLKYIVHYFITYVAEWCIEFLDMSIPITRLPSLVDQTKR